MSSGGQMTVLLDDDVLRLVRDAVASGEYASEREVVADALRGLLSDRVDKTRRLWREGLESGPGQFSTIEEIKAEAQRRRAAQVNRAT